MFIENSGEMMIQDIKINDIKNIFKERNRVVNKGDFGKVGIIGGSSNYIGALKLAVESLAALKSGCGLVKIIVPHDIVPFIAPIILEQTLFSYNSLEDIKDIINDLDVLVLGMGWEVNSLNYEILQFILTNFEKTLIIDAGGLSNLNGHLELLKSSNANIVLTPHMKEFSRLIAKDIKLVEKQKNILVQEFTHKYKVILVLKDYETLISDENIIYISKYGSAGMATSGSGDVLDGIIAGLLAYNSCSCLTVAAAVVLNGIAGSKAALKYSDISMTASNTIEFIGAAIREIRNYKDETSLASFNDFLKLDIRVGTIIKVDNFLKAKKSAYKLEIDFGKNIGIKKSSAQITTLYLPEELIGQQILAVVNFPKKQVADFISEVLVLGIYSKDGVVLIKPEKKVFNGDKLG